MFLPFFLPVNRFHNNTLMEEQSESTLVIRELRPEQSGEYYCRASAPTGAIKTKPATLRILGVVLTKRKCAEYREERIVVYLNQIIFIFSCETQAVMSIHATPGLNPTSSAFHMTVSKTAPTHSTTMWASAPQVDVLNSLIMVSGAKTKWLTAAVWQRWRRDS